MSTYEKQIDKVRKYIEEHKAERYPFENVTLAEKDEFTKSLYLRMLCTLIRYTGEPNEMQVLYVRRLIAGIHAEQGFQEYMKMALELDTTDVDEFVTIFKEESLKYYFGIDGTILLSIAEGEEKQYELLAELVEMLGITREKLIYLTAVAKAIIAQSTEMFDDAKLILPDSVQNLSLYHYISGFYAGMIVDTPVECHIYSCNKANVDLSGYSYLSAKRVIIENISATLQENIVFNGCAEVIIRNCKFIGNEFLMEFNGVGNVTVEDCVISDFTNRFAYFTDINGFIIRKNRFLNCGHSGGSNGSGIWSHYRQMRGGVLNCKGNVSGGIVLQNNELLNCYIARTEFQSGYVATGIFLHLEHTVNSIKVLENQFNGCECRKSDTTIPHVYISTSEANSISVKEEEGNVCTGSVTKIFA